MSDFERCSMEQAQLIDRLVRLRVITDEERAPILEHLTRGTLSKERASDGISWLLDTIRERKQEQKNDAA